MPQKQSKYYKNDEISYADSEFKKSLQKIKQQELIRIRMLKENKNPCSNCKYSGKINYDNGFCITKIDCDECNGKGYINAPETK